jgi:hypothetical protein
MLTTCAMHNDYGGLFQPNETPISQLHRVAASVLGILIHPLIDLDAKMNTPNSYEYA